MFRWTKESIEWYINAAEYTGYPEILCEQLREFFEKDDTVYDIGCGLGHIDFLLSPYVKQITGVDVDADVLELMQQKIGREHLANVKTMHVDWKELRGELCDVALACSFGSLRRDLGTLLSLCRKRLIIVKRNALMKEDGFITEYNMKNGSAKDEAYLNEQGISYQLKTFVADFGQPFKSEKEARRFIDHYKLEPWKSIPDYSMEAYLLSDEGNGNRDRGIQEGKYRYYLPNHKEVHIITIEK